MPNWCENYIDINHDDPKMIEKFVEAFNKKEVANTFRPQPENLFKGNVGQSEREMCEQQGIPNWYDWNSENWGTKWDFGFDNYGGRQPVEWDRSNQLRVFFMTAWSPPIELYEYMTSEHGFHIYGEYLELGMQFLGRWESGIGEIETISFPNSHDELHLLEDEYPLMYSTMEQHLDWMEEMDKEEEEEIDKAA